MVLKYRSRASKISLDEVHSGSQSLGEPELLRSLAGERKGRRVWQDEARTR